MREPVSANARPALAQPRAAVQQQEPGISGGDDTLVSRTDRARRSVLARTIAGAVAVLSWLGPVQISWQAAQQSAAIIATHG
ncbi:hypothetical protein, partial [Ralstonia holmesii]